MSKAEILEKFRRLPFEEKCELMQAIQDEFVPSWPAGEIARFEEQIERVRSHPEKAAVWDRVRQQRDKGR